MTIYDNKYDSINDRLDKLKSENKSIVECHKKIIVSISELKLVFSSRLNACFRLEDLEKIINASSKEKESNQEIKNDEVEEESPAAIRPMLIWPNGEKVWTHNSSLKQCTFTIDAILPPTFNIPVRVIKASTGSMVLGVSTKPLDTTQRYLGGDMGRGSWGIAGNASLGEDGKWSNGKRYQEGDIVTISGNNGFVTYHINNDDNSIYQYNMNTTTLYFGVTTNDGDILELLL